MYGKIFSEKRVIQQQISKAVKNREFSLVFQPIIDHSKINQTIYAAEVLLRWNQKTFKNLGPEEFIPILEDTEMIHNVGYWVIETVAQYLQSWKLISPLKMHINISAQQLGNDNFSVTVQKIINRYHISPEHLVFEITEHSLLLINPIVLENVHKLKEIGIIFAIDDFGTGYSNYKTLSNIPFSILKIDREFIHKSLLTIKDNYLLDNMIRLGKTLNLALIAEGVETKQMLNHIIKKGCSLIQGYYYSKPLTPSDFLVYIRENHSVNKII